MSLFTLALSALTLGFVHGLGADHLMAIAALTVDAGRIACARHVMQTAVGFAVGHTVVLGLGASPRADLRLGAARGVRIRSRTCRRRRSSSRLACVGLWGVTSGRAYGHVHAEIGRPTRWHFHFGRSTASHPAHIALERAGAHGRGVRRQQPARADVARAVRRRRRRRWPCRCCSCSSSSSALGILAVDVALRRPARPRAVDSARSTRSAASRPASWPWHQCCSGVYWMLIDSINSEVKSPTRERNSVNPGIAVLSFSASA